MQAHRIEVRPNHSLSWRASRRIILFLAIVTLGIGLSFASLGLWPILPFAGLETLLVAWAIWSVQRRLHMHEIIEVTESAIRILERGPRHIRERFFCPRAWAFVVERRAAWRGHPSRVFVLCKGREWEIGRSLPAVERSALAQRVGRLLGPLGSSGMPAG
ncbi:MAG: DUF2244 domain-containing protein [Gammaproteobacteria bacterium]|nr:MAG: DUF2244 domain-containing protein [Gammaproteobacteria bacterium]